MKKNNAIKIFVYILVLMLMNGCVNSTKEIEVMPLDIKKKVENKIVNSDYDIEIIRTEGSLIIGTIINMNSHPILFETTEIFIYDILNDEIMFYDIMYEGRVFDFIIIDNIIYCIVINGTNTELFKWNFIAYDTNLKESVSLRSGKLTDPINIPRILGLYDSSLILFFMNNDGNNLKYEFVKYYNDEFQILIDGQGKVNENVGTLPYNVYNYYLNDNYMYYTLLDELGNQQLYSYDLKKNNYNLIFENDKKNGFLNSYKINYKYKYFQIINSYNANSKLVVQKENEKPKEFNGNVNTFENFISEDEILVHNEGDIWKILNLEDLSFISINFNIFSKPKYHLISENMILISSKDGNYYLVEIV